MDIQKIIQEEFNSIVVVEHTNLDSIKLTSDLGKKIIENVAIKVAKKL